MAALNLNPKSVSASNDWELAEDGVKPPALLIQLRRRAFVFPWFRFAFAEGDDSTVQIVFSEHTVKITGRGLEALIFALGSHSVTRIAEPSENDAAFGARGPHGSRFTGPAIHSIAVETIERD